MRGWVRKKDKTHHFVYAVLAPSRRLIRGTSSFATLSYRHLQPRDHNQQVDGVERLWTKMAFHKHHWLDNVMNTWVGFESKRHRPFQGLPRRVRGSSSTTSLILHHASQPSASETEDSQRVKTANDACHASTRPQLVAIAIINSSTFQSRSPRASIRAPVPSADLFPGPPSRVQAVTRHNSGSAPAAC